MTYFTALLIPMLAFVLCKILGLEGFDYFLISMFGIVCGLIGKF